MIFNLAELYMSWCVVGLCVCDHPWIGDDCCVNMNDAPDHDIIGSGTPCDLNRYACNSVNLYGDNFAEVENLTCHYKNLAVSLAMIIHLEFMLR